MGTMVSGKQVCAKHLFWRFMQTTQASGLMAGGTAGPIAYASKDRLTKEQALFAQRCQAAGVKIHRVVDNVEGIYLLKVRPQQINLGNQFALDDPYGRNLGGDGYLYVEANEVMAERVGYMMDMAQGSRAGGQTKNEPGSMNMTTSPTLLLADGLTYAQLQTPPPTQIPATLRLWRNASAGS